MTGEVFPLPCGRNGCPHCRRRNVQQTAAKMALNQNMRDRPVTHAVLSTTRDWVDDATMREGWHQFARRVRREVSDDAAYAWFREWTTGDGPRSDGIRRTHYHSTWALESDEQAQRVAEISNDVWGRLTAATSEKAHGWKRVYDAGGLARYIAGLVGHHLKSGQAPPPGWAGRRYGTSRGFYAIDSRELDAQAKAVVRDERLRHHLERAIAEGCDPDNLPPWDVVDEVVTEQFEQARSRPLPRIVRVPDGFWA